MRGSFCLEQGYMKSIEKVTIVGMGALGLLYGSFLIDAGEEVRYVMDPERLAKYRGSVFYLNGKPFYPPMISCEEAQPADLAIVAVKYPGFASAMDTIRTSVGAGTILMSVMNGISSEELLSERYGQEHLIYTVAQGMDAMRFGKELNYSVMGDLRIGAKEECQKENVATVARFFDRTGMPYVVEEDILHRLWGKLMLNVGVNQTCMVYETTYGGVLLKGEANRTMIAAMREVIAIARAEGIGIDEADLNEYIEILGKLSPDNMPSMRQDALSRRPSEVELFAGTVLRLAKKHGILVPANEFLYERIQEMEKDYQAV